MITALLIGAGALWLINRHKSVSGIGKVERIKRRIYKEVSLAQDAGVDFSKKFPELSRAEMDALEHIGKDLIGWKQSKRSIESGKPYVESYYGSLRRAWNAVSGVQGIGRAYDVRNADGDVVLTWNDVKEHIQQEPDAHTMLALPPHIEPKKPKAKKPSKKEQAGYNERLEFALMIWDQFLETMKGYEFDDKISPKAHAIMQEFNSKHEFTADAYAKNLLRVKRKRGYGDVVEYNMDGKWYVLATGNTQFIVDYVRMIFEHEKQAQADAGWRDNAERLDEIRRALLDRAKLMQVVINPYDEYKDKTHYVEKYGSVHDYGTAVSGDERYNYLDKINYVVWVSKRTSEQGGMTYYPIRSYPDYDGAEIFVLNKYGKTGAKVIPVWDVPIEKITGVSGIGGERFDARYVSDRSGNWYVMLDESFLPEMIRRGASEYDITVAQNQLDSCGRIIVFIEDWLQTLDNEYYLEEVYYIIDKMREHGDL